MAVQNQDTIFIYQANGVTGSFAYGCQVLESGDLKVFVNDVEAAVGFTITGIGNPTGGSVDFSVDPVVNTIIRLERIVTLQRLTDYQQNGDFLSTTVNKDFDRLWMAHQQAKAALDNSIKFPSESPLKDSVLPSAAARANRTLVFDVDGNVSVSADDYTDNATAAAASAAAAAASESTVNAAAAEVEIDRVSAEAAAVAAAASAASIDPSNLVHRTGAESIAGIKTFASSPVVPAGFCWMTKAIGEPFALRDDLAGVEIPPTDNAAYRYIKLTASDAYNTGVLTSESVSGSAPDVIATAVISLAGSPINGLTVNLLNTERRFIRAGSSGTTEADTYRAHTHSFPGQVPITNIGGSSSDAPVSNNRVAVTATDSSGGIETKPKNQGATFYMRIK